MPKTKETRLPLKGENPKKAPKLSETARKAPPHSEEIVVDSDSEGSTSDSSSGHSSGSESDPEKRRNTKKPNVKRAKETEPADPPVPDDSEESSSDSEDEIAADGAKGGLQDTVIPANGAEDEESSDESEGEDDESEEEAPAAKTNGAKSKAQEQALSKEARKEASNAGAAAVTFAPPPGFAPVDVRKAKKSTVDSLLSSSSLGSKQIWHITAPSSVPISQITSVSLSQTQNHQSILNHKGTEYTLAEDASKEGNHQTRVLVPTDTGKGYASVDAPVSRTLHLQQVVRIPNLHTQQLNPAMKPDNAATVQQPSVRRARPQPKGLRMRSKPIGFGTGDVGALGSDDDSDLDADGDVEMGTADSSAKTFQAPRGTDARGEKRKLEDGETPRKDKKRRLQEEKASKAEDALVDGTNAEVPMTKEEKARRKEEKRARKERKKSGMSDA
ncbi:hypothetical protein M8818_000119 [Zalaria obscura]|uniref:Uncharacterized protein n=1 Tax=Zalaria obscura TaxID=2024903 RepID=A0ACC3SP64_9PEZI